VDCGGSKWQQLFTFDAFGNIAKSGNSSFAATYSTTNQFTVLGVTITYDANGNLLTDNLSNTYTWDPNWGNPASVNSTNLIYDALGQMVEQQNGSNYTQMLYSQLGKTALMSGQALAKAFIKLPGGGTAIYNSTGLAYYRHTDWLGSSKLTSTSSRTVSSDLAYAPYGEQYLASGTGDPSFTGQNSDITSSLYDFTFREHSPSQGRWISPDPDGAAAVDMTNPQTWNRYAYVVNSPLSLIDPLGLDPPCTEDMDGVPCMVSPPGHGGVPCTGYFEDYGAGQHCVIPPSIADGCSTMFNEQGMYLGSICGVMPNVIGLNGTDSGRGGGGGYSPCINGSPVTSATLGLPSGCSSDPFPPGKGLENAVKTMAQQVPLLEIVTDPCVSDNTYTKEHIEHWTYTGLSGSAIGKGDPVTGILAAGLDAAWDLGKAVVNCAGK
jgi:RHS repeat-associated protein